MSALTELLERLALGQSGALWLFLLAAFLVFGNLRRPVSRRNLALLLLVLPALPLLDIMRWEQHLGQGKYGWLLGAAFTGLFAATAFMSGWALMMSRRSPSEPWEPNIPVRSLKALLIFVVLLSVVTVIGRPPDDAGFYTNLGARRWLETGTMPYGDPLLRGPDSPAYGAAATYGPLLYLAHIPFQFFTGATWNGPELNPMSPDYVLPPVLATKLTCLAFHLLGLWALYSIGRRLRDEATGLALAILYAGSPYVMGLGGHDFQITGLVFISHIAPTAVMLLAFLNLDRPAVCGALVAVAAGCLFFPAFFFPLFLGWYAWRRRGALKFAAGFAAAGAAIALLVVVATDSIGDDGPVRLFLKSTLEHQEGTGPREYGASLFSFWGTHPGLASFWQQPLFGDSSLFKPTFLLFAGLCLSAFFLAKGRSRTQLALLVATLAAAIQLWKTHAGGSYVEWYFPFLLIGLAAATRNADAELPEEGGVPAAAG